MAIKVIKTIVNESEISSEIDLDITSGLTKQQQNRIKDEAGEFLVDTILGRVGQAKSPFIKGAWPALSKEYKKIKKAEGRGTKANLELNGDMLDEFEFKRSSKGIKLQVTGTEAPKADGHNNFSGKSKIPTRQFLPKKDDKFVGNVNKNIRSIISDEVAKTTRIKKRDLSGIETKRQLNTFLREQFPGVQLLDIKNSILVDDELRDIFTIVLGLF